MKTEKYNVTGMTCAACQANVTRCVQKLDGRRRRQRQPSGQSDDRILRRDQGGFRYHHPAGEGDRLRRLPAGAAQAKSRGLSQRVADARQELAEDSQQEHEAPADLLRPSSHAPDVHCHGTDDVAAGARHSLAGMENALVSALAQLLLTVPVLFINRHFFQQRLSRRCFTGRPIWIPWWRSARARRWCTGCSPCSGWPMASAMATWNWCTNTPTRCILSRPP